MPIIDDFTETYLLDKIQVGQHYHAYTIDVMKDEREDIYYVTFYIPEFDDFYREKGKGFRVSFKPKELKLSLQFLYAVNFPGKEVEPKRMSNVVPKYAKEFYVEDLNNWIGLKCNLIFGWEKSYQDPSKMYKKIVRSFTYSSDGIQPWENGKSLTAIEIDQLRFRLNNPETKNGADSQGADDLPF